jgi:hypothetical protein
MAEPKTKPTTKSALEFLSSIEPLEKRNDSLVLLKMFENVTGQKPVMWGSGIVGFGMYHYKSERSSQEGDWPLVGFSPRKQYLTLYIITGIEHEQELLSKLGKYKTSKACLYINKLADIDEKVLTKLIDKSFKAARQMLKTS